MTNPLLTMVHKPTSLARKRKELRAALSLAGLTQKEWARKQGITPEHLSYVMNGHRESERLLQEVDAFIAKHLEKLGAA